MTNDVSAATGGSSLASSTDRSGSDGAQTVAASATPVTPPAAVLNLAMQVGDCLLSAGMSANDVVVAMLGITDAYGLGRQSLAKSHHRLASRQFGLDAGCERLPRYATEVRPQNHHTAIEGPLAHGSRSWSDWPRSELRVTPAPRRLQPVRSLSAGCLDLIYRPGFLRSRPVQRA